MAKQSKKLTRNQKELLTNLGYEAENCRFLEEIDGYLYFLDTTTGDSFFVESPSEERTYTASDISSGYSAGSNKGTNFALDSYEYTLYT